MKLNHAKQTLIAYLLTGLVSLFFLVNTARADAPPEHLFWAEDIAVNVSPDKNSYASDPSYILWPDANGIGDYENRTKCASFITQTLMQGYRWTSKYFQSWLTSPSPTAEKYYTAIKLQNRFVRISYLVDIKPGDLIAIKYPAGSPVTGHMAIARSSAIPRTPTLPYIKGTNQYEIQIIDSSQTGHGPKDSRLMRGGAYHPGVGIGILRLYADKTDMLVGYTWSTNNNSIFYSQKTRPIAIGRLMQ